MDPSVLEADPDPGAVGREALSATRQSAQGHGRGLGGFLRLLGSADGFARWTVAVHEVENIDEEVRPVGVMGFRHRIQFVLAADSDGRLV